MKKPGLAFAYSRAWCLIPEEEELTRHWVHDTLALDAALCRFSHYGEKPTIGALHRMRGS